MTEDGQAGTVARKGLSEAVEAEPGPAGGGALPGIREETLISLRGIQVLLPVEGTTPVGECEGDDPERAQARQHLSGAWGGILQKRGGYLRRGGSLGRYPWLAIVNRYIEAGKKYWSQETTDRKRRGLVRIGRNLELLRLAGKVTTTNPEKITQNDIEAYDRWNAERERGNGQKGIKIVSRAKDIELINGLTLFCGNPVIEAMRKLPGNHGLPKRPTIGPKISYSEKTVIDILGAAMKRAREAESPNGWRDVATLGWLAIENGFGPRPREARFLLFGDLDMHQCKIRIDHPKGEGRYSDGDWITLIPTFRQHLIEYLQHRARYLERAGVNPNDPRIPLVPKIFHGQIGTYSQKQVAKVHRQLARETGIKIRPKDGRTSFGQNFIDHGFTVDEVSKRMRHATVATTQRFYIELRPDDDFDRLRARYEATAKPPDRAPKVNPSGLTENDTLNYYR